MDRRSFVRAVGTGALGVGAVTAFKCSPETEAQIEKWDDLVIQELTAIKPELVTLGLSTALIDKTIGVAKDLNVALKASNHASTLDLLGQLTAPDGLIQQLAADIGIVSNDTARKIMEAALIIAHTTLLLIAANIVSSVPASAKVAARTAGHGVAVTHVENAANSIDGLFKSTFPKK